MSEKSLKEMVERVSWFKPADYEILLFFENHDIRLSAQILAANMDYSREYVNKRLRKLKSVNLLQSEKGIYELTDFGREFLAGNVDEDELPEP